jgi:glycosyltransferase involved in cell wall biosynthesis
MRMNTKVCFIGAARYGSPLDPTSEKKFRVLETLGELFVVGFSEDMRPRRFAEHAHFYLLPNVPAPIVRYLEIFALVPVICFWLIMRRGVNVLIAQSPYEGFVAAVAKIVAGWLGCKVRLVVESHGDFEASVFMQRRIVFPSIYGFLMRHCANFTLNQADCSRAVSNSTREQLERWSPGKQMFQFPTWTDIEVFLQAGADKQEPSGQEILYAGVLIPRKGVHHLINAFVSVSNDFPAARLFIVGHEENKAYAGELKKQVERLGLARRVQFKGRVQQADLAAWMRRACMFVLPTYSEGLPRVVFEAMAAKLPVIATNVSGIPDVLQDAVTGFTVSPGDEVALAEKIRWILEHPDNAFTLGRCAHDFAKEFFSTKAYVENYARMFTTSFVL